MPRPRRLRKIVAPPAFKGYKPYGTDQPANDTIDLLYEEYEALKLADYDLLNHQEASELMGVSRATFARIYESARRKIAKALVETKSITAVFGHSVLDNSWRHCKSCHARFTQPKVVTDKNCPMCNSSAIDVWRAN